MRVTKWDYQCGACGLEYEMPGADDRFSYTEFLGVSRNLEAIVFDALAFDGFAELTAMLEVLRRRWPQQARSIDIDVILGEVCDPDSLGDRYVFGGTPGCPACGSRVPGGVRETPVVWPRSPADASHTAWDQLSAADRLARLCVGFDLDPAQLADNP